MKSCHVTSEGDAATQAHTRAVNLVQTQTPAVVAACACPCTSAAPRRPCTGYQRCDGCGQGPRWRSGCFGCRYVLEGCFLSFDACTLFGVLLSLLWAALNKSLQLPSKCRHLNVRFCRYRAAS